MRRLFTLCSALSLLLCIAVCVLWVRSYVVPAYPQTWLAVGPLRWAEGRGYAWVQVLGWRPVRRGAETHQQLHTLIWVRVRYWQAAMGTGTLPACWVVRRGMKFWIRLRMRQRGAAGLCSRCGYDLRASPDRCPECGAAAAGTS